MNKFFPLLLAIAVCYSGVSYAKPTAPISIEYDTPDTLSIGAQTTTIIKFIAKTNLRELIVSAAPYKGLGLLSGEKIKFTDLKKGDIKKLTVTIQLEEPTGYLSIFSTSIDMTGKKRSKNIAVKYNAIEKFEIQKSKSIQFIENAKGEKLILMPGESRQ